MRKNLDIQIRQIAPYWVLGIVLGSAVSVFGKRYIHGAFSKIGKKRTGWLGMIPASLLGIASPLCMYGTIPIAAAFSEQGVADGRDLRLRKDLRNAPPSGQPQPW